ncbi:hypothetical protein XA26_08000 [Mycolicibacterium fortuitum]|uniref:Uncharacterized protein n=1 Tax=Mycolicibacterium fortuitum TaxID=1766 RepID=A0A0N9XF02_MYCFO|nr:hypothetical protein XA26_08000 [Mycolicibacterium fortuitum]
MPGGSADVQLAAYFGQGQVTARSVGEQLDDGDDAASRW